VLEAPGRYGSLVRPSSRVAFAISWVVFALVVVLAWRKVLAAPNGDVNRLLVATVAGGLGLALLGAWLQDHERDR
jgi:ABC-type sugar transport system permease subunit